MSASRTGRDARLASIRDLAILVALAALPLALAARTLRSGADPVIKGIIAGAAVFVPAVVAVVWTICGLHRPREDRHRDDLFVIVYMGLTFVSVLAVVFVFMLDRPSAGWLGASLFGLLAYLSTWI